MYKKKFLQPYCLLLLLCACASKNITQPLTSTLHTEGMHHKWQVTRLGNDTAIAYAYIDLRDVFKSAAGTACDSFSVTPKYWYNRQVDFMHIGLEKRRCAGDAAYSAALVNALKNTKRYVLYGDRLSLTDGGGTTLLQAVIDPADENGSLQREWEITEIINTKAKDLAGKHYQLHLANNGQGTATIGCSTYPLTIATTGPYKLSITTDNGAKKYCKKEEEIFIKLLPLLYLYQVTGNTMIWFDKNGDMLLKAVEKK